VAVEERKEAARITKMVEPTTTKGRKNKQISRLSRAY